MLAMLFPRTVGNLPGVPFQHRAQANDVAVVAALDAERDNLRDLQARHAHHQGDWDFLGLDNNDLEGPIEDAEQRMRLDESILDDDRTGSDMSNLQGTADRSQIFVNASRPDELAMVSWMGGDLPDSVLRDAPFASYAGDLGPLLAGFSHDVHQEIDHSAGADHDTHTTVTNDTDPDGVRFSKDGATMGDIVWEDLGLADVGGSSGSGGCVK